MKKIISALFVSAFLLIGSNANAQLYTNAVGLGVDVGDGSTLVGPTFKHFFTETGAVDVSVLFGNGATFVGAAYQHNMSLANNVNWYLGVGPTLGFGNNNTAFYIRPMGGIEAKINNAPLAVSADWRPMWYLGDGGSDFNAARFQLGFKVPF